MVVITPAWRGFRDIVRRDISEIRRRFGDLLSPTLLEIKAWFVYDDARDKFFFFFLGVHAVGGHDGGSHRRAGQAAKATLPTGVNHPGRTSGGKLDAANPATVTVWPNLASLTAVYGSSR